MVNCGACKQPILDATGTRERTADEVPHKCRKCKAPLHSEAPLHSPLHDCTVWMPLEDFFFCNQLCLQARNESNLEIAKVENDDSEFGPGREGWDDVVTDDPTLFLPLCRRPDEEPVAKIVEELLSSESEDEPEEKKNSSSAAPAPEEHTSQTGVAELRSLLSPGTRLQECFKVDDSEEGAWFGGVVGDAEPDGRIPIGFDDGELRLTTADELRGLYSMGKLSSITVNGGLVADKALQQKALGLCIMKCGGEDMPIGVLLLDSAKPVLAGVNLYHSHILSVDAVDAALSAAQPRNLRQVLLIEPRHRAGYHTFRHGDKLVYTDEEVVDTIEEICMGVMLILYRRTQQLRFIVSFDSSLTEFSVAPWTAWRRISTSPGADLDLDDSSNVVTANASEVAAMEAAWSADANKLPSEAATVDKLKKAATLGPASLRIAKAAALREQKRIRKNRVRVEKEEKAAQVLFLPSSFCSPFFPILSLLPSFLSLLPSSPFSPPFLLLSCA